MPNNKCELFNKATISLAKEVVLRKEPWGGLIFHQNSGNVVDVDNEAFALLSLLKKGGVVHADNLFASCPSKSKTHDSLSKHMNNTAVVLKHFIDLGIVKIVQESSFAGNSSLCKADQIAFNHIGADSVNLLTLHQNKQVQKNNHALSAPETVHWAVSFNCLQECPDCYVRRYRGQHFPELPTAKALQVVETIAGLNVFQLAIGGGEPLLRSDLPLIARVAKDSGLVVHVTTGLIEGFDFQLLKKLAPSIISLHIGINHERLLAMPKREVAMLRQILQAAQTIEIALGANLILCNNVLAHFRQIIDSLVQAGFKRIILLRYKPPADVNRWLMEKPSPEAYFDFQAVLRETVKLYPQVKFRLDCALSFLQRHLNPAGAFSAGLRGCVAGNRVMAIGPDGSVYPCSQLMSSGFNAGNILREEFHNLWNSAALKRYRGFRNAKSIQATKCGVCLASLHCGGCRVFAHDAMGEDPGCLDALYPPVQRLGREGRKAVLRSYIKRNFSISVEKYMDHFQVGQKTAIIELKNMNWLMLENKAATGNKKEDTYISTDAYLLEDIQELIGFTSCGSPFVSTEEINKWLAEPEQLDYPRWLLKEYEEQGAST